MIVRRFLLAALLGLVVLPAPAREFRSIQPISRPESLPPGARPIIDLRPVPREAVARAVEGVARAWNGGALDAWLSADFAARDRLLDTIAEAVPRDARLTVLAVQSVSTLSQYAQDGKVVSTVSAVVRSQVEFNDPTAGFRRLEGSGEWYFRVEEDGKPAQEAVTTATLHRDAMAAHGRRIAMLNARIATRALPPPVTAAPPVAAPVPALPASPPLASVAPSRPGSSALSIAEIVPASPRWDQLVTIRGEGFGDRAGGVYAVLPDAARTTLTFRVVGWADRGITAILDAEQIERLRWVRPFGAEPMRAAVWILRAGGDRDGIVGTEVLMRPPPSLLTPVISDIQSGAEGPTSPASVTPGQTLRVIGRNFLERPGSVTFRIGGRDIPADIVSWRCDEVFLNCHVDAGLPGLSGLAAQAGSVRVANRLGWSAEAPIRFEPVMDSAIVSDRFSFMTTEFKRVQRWLLEGRLRNGWTPTGWHDPWVGGVPGRMACLSGMGVRVFTPPVAGADSARTLVACDCALGSVECGVEVQIIGPLGTEHGR